MVTLNTIFDLVFTRVGHWVHFTNNMWHDTGMIKIRKEFQTRKGLSKVDNPITSKVDKYKYGPLFFCRSNIGVEFEDTRIYVQYHSSICKRVRNGNRK